MNSVEYIDKLVERLKKASIAYYETGESEMTDAEYDTYIEEVREKAPKHPFLKEVGPKPRRAPIELPCPMPSLRKLKPETFNTWSNKGPYVISDKLDGISALWDSYNNRLFLRGNGMIGQDISHCINGIQGLKYTLINDSEVREDYLIRGELITTKRSIVARNWVNGVIHQSSPAAADLFIIRFVAYQVILPKIAKRSEQFEWLVEKGFYTANWSVSERVSSKFLESIFLDRRENSEYECDGIVVGTDACRVGIPTDASEPKDSIAFKMSIDSQRATTTVLSVEWTSSKGWLWIPRVHFEKVLIGSSSIEWATGYSAKFITSEKIGPGAKIIVRRSGDVIPIIEKVLEPSTKIIMPPDACWRWDDTKTHAVDTTVEITDEKYCQQLVHLLVTLGIEGFSLASIQKLVKVEIKTPIDLLETTPQKLRVLLGGTLGPRLYEKYMRAVTQASPEQWIKGWTEWPRGFGEKKIQTLLSLCNNVAKWKSIKAIPEKQGISMESLKEIQARVPEFLIWRSKFDKWANSIIPPDDMSDKTEEELEAEREQRRLLELEKEAERKRGKGKIVFSGFRDQNLEVTLNELGWKVCENVTKDVNFLIVPATVDGIEPVITTKVKQALKLGITILSKSVALTNL
jgi:DNA ligase (NAD+)